MSSREFSRRLMLHQLATAAGAATAFGAGARWAVAQAKLPKTQVSYQEQPNGTQRCDSCAHFQAPSSCNVVEGQISSSGWCKAYSPKPS